MNEQLYNKWIDALENDAYKPAKEYLRTNTDEYCCLGVLCDVYDTTQWTKEPNGFYKHSGYKNELPSHIKDELNLVGNLAYFRLEDLSEELQAEIHPNVRNRKILTTDYNCTLTFINDDTPPEINPFPIIAKILRERPRSLFRQ